MGIDQDPLRGLALWMYNKSVTPERLGEKGARAEYARLAAAANKRIRRLAESPDFADATAASHDYFPSVSTFQMTGKDNSPVYAALSDVARFMSRKTTSLSGLRKMELAQLETLRGREGYEFLNKGNIHQFRLFWDEVRKHATAVSYGSDQIVDLYKKAREKRIDPVDMARDFEIWMANKEKLSDVKRSASTLTSEEARERFNIKPVQE